MVDGIRKPPRRLGPNVPPTTTPAHRPGVPAGGTATVDTPATSDFHSGLVTGPTATVVTARVVAAPTLGSLIDGATKRVFVRAGTVPPNAVMDKLIAAAQRGVDVHLLISSSQRLNPEQVMSVLRLSDEGIEVGVVQQSALPDRAGLSDSTSFVGGKVDPVTGEAPAKVSTNAAEVDKQLNAFRSELAVRVNPSFRVGLLPPGQVKVHEMPGATSAPILNAINSAKSSIDLEIYQVGDRGVIDALKAAAGRGVKVRVMLEPRTVGAVNYPAVQKELATAGIDVQPTPPTFDQHNNVDHAKFMVIDQKELLVGTGNLVRYGLGGNELTEANSRDFWVEDSRPQSVKEGSGLFEADWARKPTKAADFKNLVVTPDNASSSLLALIDAAHEKLYLENQSLNDKVTIDHLIAAKKRGVDVKVLLGVQPIPHMPPKNEAVIKQLRAAGIDAGYLTQSYLHAKTVITESKLFIGSQNFTGGGLGKNREVGELLDDAALVSQAQAQFNADFADPGPKP